MAEYQCISTPGGEGPVCTFANGRSVSLKYLSDLRMTGPLGSLESQLLLHEYTKLELEEVGGEYRGLFFVRPDDVAMPGIRIQKNHEYTVPVLEEPFDAEEEKKLIDSRKIIDFRCSLGDWGYDLVSKHMEIERKCTKVIHYFEKSESGLPKLPGIEYPNNFRIVVMYNIQGD